MFALTKVASNDVIDVYFLVPIVPSWGPTSSASLDNAVRVWETLLSNGFAPLPVTYSLYHIDHGKTGRGHVIRCNLVGIGGLSNRDPIIMADSSYNCSSLDVSSKSFPVNLPASYIERLRGYGVDFGITWAALLQIMNCKLVTVVKNKEAFLSNPDYVIRDTVGDRLPVAAAVFSAYTGNAYDYELIGNMQPYGGRVTPEPDLTAELAPSALIDADIQALHEYMRNKNNKYCLPLAALTGFVDTCKRCADGLPVLPQIDAPSAFLLISEDLFNKIFVDARDILKSKDFTLVGDAANIDGLSLMMVKKLDWDVMCAVSSHQGSLCPVVTRRGDEFYVNNTPVAFEVATTILAQYSMVAMENASGYHHPIDFFFTTSIGSSVTREYYAMRGKDNKDCHKAWIDPPLKCRYDLIRATNREAGSGRHAGYALDTRVNVNASNLSAAARRVGIKIPSGMTREKLDPFIFSQLSRLEELQAVLFAFPTGPIEMRYSCNPLGPRRGTGYLYAHPFAGLPSSMRPKSLIAGSAVTSDQDGPHVGLIEYCIEVGAMRELSGNIRYRFPGMEYSGSGGPLPSRIHTDDITPLFEVPALEEEVNVGSMVAVSYLPKFWSDNYEP